MQGRARVLLATAARVALPLLVGGCFDRYAPDEAPPLASVATIPVAAPGATGVAFESPRPYGAAAGRPGYPSEPAEPLPETKPLPLPEESSPSPFVEPSPPPQKKKDAGGAATGPLPKGVQL